MEKSEWVEVYEDASGDWRWRRKAANGRILAESGESFEGRSYAEAEAADNNRGADGEPLEVRAVE